MIPPFVSDPDTVSPAEHLEWSIDFYTERGYLGDGSRRCWQSFASILDGLPHRDMKNVVGALLFDLVGSLAPDAAV